MSAVHIIRYAEPNDVAQLPAIEVAAAGMFDDADLSPQLKCEATDIETLERAQCEGRLWVAAFDEHPIGYAYWVRHENDIYLAQMDVHPDHGRQGIGKRLVRAIARQAHRNGAESVTLTTFKHIPWNGPYYERLGFERVGNDIPTYLQEILANEAAMGLAAENRIAMRLAPRD